MKDLTSLLALLVSLAALAVTIYIWYKNSHFTAFFSSISNTVGVESRIGEVPSVLKFHGITQEELKEAGLTAKEFAYLLTSFTSGGIYYRAHYPNDTQPFERGSYRYNMLAAPATQKAWPLIKKMLVPSNYRNRLDATIIQINNSNKKKS